MLFGYLLIFANSNLFACACSHPKILKELKNNYQYAFVGDVLDVKRIEWKGTIEEVVTFKIMKQFINTPKHKKIKEKIIKVSFPYGSSSCHLIKPNFKMNERWTLTVSKNKSREIYDHNFCNLKTKHEKNKDKEQISKVIKSFYMDWYLLNHKELNKTSFCICHIDKTIYRVDFVAVKKYIKFLKSSGFFTQIFLDGIYKTYQDADKIMLDRKEMMDSATGRVDKPHIAGMKDYLLFGMDDMLSDCGLSKKAFGKMRFENLVINKNTASIKITFVAICEGESWQGYENKDKYQDFYKQEFELKRINNRWLIDKIKNFEAL